ncbi:hypothetical protein N7532_003636 [Penicillium argentinense]|uniref:Uncharacterized protein n=1 Tax=Penicillium argentinense TaxID=1131581 RepID=A0A9W9FMW6_9EURO|nr:uncharacterized protein N7532_003636 [Penicillium argentinense]KAJ5103107.1 hypothetical protein N7532_003636 [Penicillium argentinense]
MVLLLIEEMITVGTDFHILLRMINSFVRSPGGSRSVEKEPLGRFLCSRFASMFLSSAYVDILFAIRMSFYAAPLDTGYSATKILQNVIPEHLDFLYSYLAPYPEYTEIIYMLADLIQKAAQIYQAHAANMPDAMIGKLVQSFLKETSTFNTGSPGGHILIWPFFIV